MFCGMSVNRPFHNPGAFALVSHFSYSNIVKSSGSARLCPSHGSALVAGSGAVQFMPMFARFSAVIQGKESF